MNTETIPDWLAGLGSQSVNPFASAEIISVNTDPTAYHQQDAKRGDPDYIVSRSDLISFARCPHRWIAGHQESESDAMGWGSLVDCLLLTPERFSDCYVIQPSTYQTDGMKCPVCGGVSDSKSCRPCKAEREPTKIEKEWSNNSETCRQWVADAAAKGLTVITADMLAKARGAVEIISGDEGIAHLLKGGERQVYILSTFNDSMTGVSVKVRSLIDLVPKLPCVGLADLKTTNNAAGESWSRKVFDSGYHVQAAIYLDSYNLATGDNRSAFFHFAQESYPPYELAKWCLTSDYIALGRSRYVKALQEYCQCLHSGKWPGYSIENGLQIEGFGIVEPKPWMVMAE